MSESSLNKPVTRRQALNHLALMLGASGTALGIAGLGGGGSNPPPGGGTDKVRIDTVDTIAAFLGLKIVAGPNITFTTLNPGGNEKIEISAAAASSDHKVLVDASDTTSDFLGPKLAAGNGIVLTTLNVGGNEQIQIAIPDPINVNQGTAGSSPWLVDVSDRAARLLGIVYGNQGQLAQRASTLDALVQLRTAGAEYDARQIRALLNTDVVTAEVSKWIGSTAPTVGQKAMASSLPIVIASDQSAVPIGNPSNLDVALSTRLADVKFPATSASADNTSNPTLTQIETFPMGFDGTAWFRQRIQNASDAYANSYGVRTVPYTLIFNGTTWDRRRSGGVTGMAGISGDTASGVADAGNPVKVGGVANTGLPAAVSSGQRTNALTDIYGRKRIIVDRPKLLGLYYAESGNLTILASAHAATVGFLWLVNTSATVIVYIRSIGFVWSGTAATAFPTSPRITIERVTFTGTPSGAQITPALRDSTDAVNVATIRTASTGLTLTAGAVIESFVVGSILTAVGAISVPEEMWQPKDDDGLIVLRQNEGIVIRQADAGTTADSRKAVLTLSWEER